MRQFHQYVVRVDGSGRVTLRNRRFLRKYTPAVERRQVVSLPLLPSLPANDPAPPPGPASSVPAPTGKTAPDQQEPPGTPPTLGPDNVPSTPASLTPLSPAPTPPAPAQPTALAAPRSTPQKLSRMLARLQPHNAPGAKEAPSRPRRQVIP